MTYSDWQGQTEADRHDMWMSTGRPCANCESEPAEHGGVFCSEEFKAEWEGTDDDTE
jgi:hypothetical protein